MVPHGFWIAEMITNFWNMKRHSKVTECNTKQNIITNADTYLTPSKETAATLGLLEINEYIEATTGLLKFMNLKWQLLDCWELMRQLQDCSTYMKQQQLLD
jgi:hypothetical protein